MTAGLAVSPMVGLALRGTAYGLSYAKAVEINYSDSDMSRDITVPPNTLIKNVYVSVPTLFDSGTSDLMNVGLSGDTDGMVDDASVASGGAFVAGDTIALLSNAPSTAIIGDDITDTATTNVIEKANGIWVESEDTITVSVTSDGTAATEGRTVVIVEMLTFEFSEIDDES